jgi:hypothetical protein
MIPKKIIELAITAGWNLDRTSMLPAKQSTLSVDEVIRVCQKGNNVYRVALDPSFWQCLGKALKWPTGKEPDVSCSMWETEGWLGRARYFNYLLLTGGYSQAFWDDLLSNSNSAAKS